MEDFVEKRVMITGMGTINPLGNDVKTFWNNLTQGKSGIKKIKRLDLTDMKSIVAGVITGFSPEDILSKKEIKRNTDFILYALWAAEQAMKDSGLDIEKENPNRLGIITGSGIGGIKDIEEQHTILLAKGPLRISPFLIVKMIADMVPGKLSMKYGFKGTNYSIASACASSTHAMIEAFHNIKFGVADIVMTGGSEAPITPIGLGGFNALNALSKQYNDEPEKSSRPFEKNRDGFVVAEGAAIFIFEEYEHAKKRGAHIYAEVMGAGSTADAFHETAPAPRAEGGRRAMEEAVRESKISLEDIGYINAHGTATRLNDKNETEAIKDMFGDHAKKLAISSIKSMIGHTLGASGAVASVASIMAINTGIIPPTINYDEPDPECDLYYVPNKAIERKVDYTLTNSFGFGGHNGVLLIGKFR
ncbi:beta-ketoacyl-ACP synthase II [bacterium]|nr:beta-ketoacyl-ACP synthase II [bacterium]